MNLSSMLRLATALSVVAGAAGAGIQTPAAAQSAADDRAVASASATYVDRRMAELRQLRSRLDAERVRIKRGIAANGQRRHLLTMELEELEAVLSSARSRLTSADARFEKVQSDLVAKDKALREMERRLERTITSLEARAVDIYKRGSVSTFELVLGSRNVGELLRRFALVLRVTHIDNQRVADMRRQKASIVTTRALVRLLRDEAAANAALVRGERDRVAGIRTTLHIQRAAVGSELSAQYARLGSIAQQKRRFEAEARELRAESSRIAAFLRGQTNSPPTVSPKGMSWPVYGPVTSGFGWRRHPILGSRRFHAGIDISAPSGTPIHAAASGKVIFAGSQTGYGKYVILYHGGKIATLYGHMSSIALGTGATVPRGQTIGRVGCTGYCTGPHLHFEVRVDGNPVNPMVWLP
jgi:murein DD-endopeptidase MepM/ murein hydrolase activator NlpD